MQWGFHLLWQTEFLAQPIDLKPGMRVLGQDEAYLENILKCSTSEWSAWHMDLADALMVEDTVGFIKSPSAILSLKYLLHIFYIKTRASMFYTVKR